MIERSNSSPVCSVKASTSPFASPERRRMVREIARSARPNDRERSRTRRFFSPISSAGLPPSLASVLTPAEASPASVGYFTSASVTVDSL
ncbi:MAG: hypothetical protein ACQSGP_09455, partial [Frankia sp.]